MLQEVSKGHRFLELDALRGLAALAVVLGHFRGALVAVPPHKFTIALHVLGGGHAAVVLFFLLSGFVLTVPYLGPKRPTYGAFITKRLCRIYLPYVAAIAIAAVLASKLYSTVPSGNAWDDQTWSQPFSLYLLAQHLLMIGRFDNVQWNTAIWSLVVEMRISIAFPLIAWATGRIPSVVLLALCIPGTLAVALLVPGTASAGLLITLFYSMIFVVGSLLRRNYVTLHSYLARSGKTFPPVLTLLAGVLLYRFSEYVPLSRLGLSPSFADCFFNWLIALGGALLILSCTTWQPARHLLHSPILQWGGTRSYSIYLLHGTVLFTLIRTHHMQRLSFSSFITYLFCVFAGAEIFHRAVEVPALLAGRKWGSKTVLNEGARQAQVTSAAA